MGNNYDPIAGTYDFLSGLVFGKAEINAQVRMLRYIAPASHILIVGGGTGWILEELAAIHPSGLRITYIESSFNMMELSKKRDCKQNEVSFIRLPVEEFVTGERYDDILTGFFFDNFSVETVAGLFRQLDSLLNDGGLWLFADFHYQKARRTIWQALMLKSMYLSARLICRVEGTALTDTESLFAAAGYKQLYAAFHYRRFIKAIAYQKMSE